MIAEISLRQRRKSRQDSASPSLRSGERETFTRAPMVACDPSLDNSGIGPTNLPHMQRVKSATSSAWFLLGVAIASEIVGVLGLRFSEGFAAPTRFCLPSTPCHARPSRCSSARGSTSPHFSPRSWSASRPGVRSARSEPKELRLRPASCAPRAWPRDAGGRLGATRRRAALSGRQCASRRLPDAPHRAARRSYSVGRTASRRL